jgi:predicted membrane protein
MAENHSNRAPAQVVLGLAVVVIGVLFLLDNFDIFDMHRVLHFWPMVFIAFGLVKIYESADASGRLVGGALTALGVLLTLGHLGWMSVSMHNLWPLFLIAGGAAIMYRSNEARAERERLQAGGQAKDGAEVLDATAILGGFDRKIVSQDFRGGQVTAIVGGCELDLREASINGEAVIKVFALMGGLSLKVPLDWQVVIRGMPIMGGFDEKTTSPVNSTKRLIIEGTVVMGGVQVRN